MEPFRRPAAARLHDRDEGLEVGRRTVRHAVPLALHAEKRTVLATALVELRAAQRPITTVLVSRRKTATLGESERDRVLLREKGGLGSTLSPDQTS